MLKAKRRTDEKQWSQRKKNKKKKTTTKKKMKSEEGSLSRMRFSCSREPRLEENGAPLRSAWMPTSAPRL